MDAGFDAALGASYRLIEQVGRGATGEVWSAIDRRTEEMVAAKLLRSEHLADQDVVGRFLRERTILTGLRHPNLVAVRDLVVEGERLAIVMDYVDGGSLRDVLTESGPLRPALAVAVTAAMLDGLAAAHDQTVLHRDIKPDNVLLTHDWPRDGRSLQPGDVRLTDFGVARIVSEGSRTTTGLLGTPEYMSPELIATGGAGLPADIYGVGVVLYELLAGRTPFAGPGTDYTVAHRHVTRQPPPLPVPASLWAVIAGMLDKDPGQRPDARTAASQLRRLLPDLADATALERQGEPESFGSAAGPQTVVRGLTPDAASPVGANDADLVAGPDRGPDTPAPESPELGAPQGETVVRPLERPRPAPVERPAPAESTAPARPWWRDPRAIGMIVAGVALIAGGVAFVLSQDDDDQSEPTGSPITASINGIALPSGLTIDRSALYDPTDETVTLTLTYSAQKAPLSGPYVEVLPAPGAGCVQPRWEGAKARENLSTTGFTEACAWSVEPPPLPARGSTEVQAVMGMTFEGTDATTALQLWLDEVAQATDALVSDAQVRSTAYPAQRIQDIVIDAPRSSVSGQTLTLRLLPVWPSGMDPANPLFKSPPIGRASSLLEAVAGGDQGVRFIDGCANGLLIKDRGQTVVALNQVPDCVVNATVGNFTEVASAPFPIVTRGS